MKNKKIRVQIVDDHIPEIISLTKLLEQEGLEIIQVFDSTDAISRARKEKPDILLSEIQLDYLSGYDLAKALPEQKILFITEMDVHESELKRFKNVFGIINKPVDVKELLRKIKDAAKKR